MEDIGAQLRGGRWNAKGRPMVYTATTPELCVLEYMVHLDGTPLAELPPLILCEITVPDLSITYLTADQLPAGWDDPYVTLPGLPDFASQQFRQYQTLCLALPSAVVPLSPSRNVLIDPLHAQRNDCRVITIQPYPIAPAYPVHLSRSEPRIPSDLIPPANGFERASTVAGRADSGGRSVHSA